MRLTPRVAGFRLEYPAGFELECMAGFVGTRSLVIGGARRSDGNHANGRSELIVDPVRKFAQQQTCFVGDSGGEDCLLRHVSVLFDRAEKCSLRLGTFLDPLRLQEGIPFPRTSK